MENLKSKEFILKSMDNVIRAVENLARERFIVLIDDEKRENEGDLVLAAE